MPENTQSVYTFEHEGETYSLPSGESVRDQIPGKFLRDAYMDGDDGEMRLAFAMLERVDATPGAVDALYSLPGPVMLERLHEWLQFKPSEEDASLGESSSSSD